MQRGYADCGVACIAMAANVEYERVLASVAPDVYFHGMYYGEVLHALKKILGKDFILYEEKDDIKLSDLDLKIGKYILFVERDFQYEDPLVKTHYVFINFGMFHDPSKDKVVRCIDILKTIVGSWKLKASIIL